MTSPPRTASVRRRPGRRAVAWTYGLLLVLTAGGAAGDEPAAHEGGAASTAGPADRERVFLPASERVASWRRAVASVGSEWPLIRVVEPDFLGDPPKAGLVETAWVEPPHAEPAEWPPLRQRMLVTVIPARDGAWLDAAVETQSLAAATPQDGVELAGWSTRPETHDVAVMLTSAVSSGIDPVVPLPPLDREVFIAPGPREPPWADSRFPRAAREGYRILEDYRNFYSCESLVCISAALGAGALMANTGFDTTMQGAWMRGVEPTAVGTFFSDCKIMGEGKYALPIFGAAAVTGLLFEGGPVGDVVGEWGSRSLRMFVVGAPPMYAMQWVTGASRPDQDIGSQWHIFNDNNGVSGHAFIGAIPFLAAADMVESPLLKGTLYVCSTFVGFSRMTDNAHFPSQVFLGWYFAWASSRAVSATQMEFAGMELRVVPLPVADLGGVGVEGRW